MPSRMNLLAGGALCLAAVFSAADDTGQVPVGSDFTGETLTLLYVSDVGRSVAFYQSLGFEHDFYYDYREEEYVLDWTRDYRPEYAEVIQDRIRIGLTTAEDPEQVLGGGVRHYFMVEDSHRHFEMAVANGLVAEPHEVEIRPWMHFFTVADPDDHQIVIGTKNDAYYDSARKEINTLKQGKQHER